MMTLQSFSTIVNAFDAATDLKHLDTLPVALRTTSITCYRLFKVQWNSQPSSAAMKHDSHFWILLSMGCSEARI